jgi:hypothetical protein
MEVPSSFVNGGALSVWSTVVDMNFDGSLRRSQKSGDPILSPDFSV